MEGDGDHISRPAARAAIAPWSVGLQYSASLGATMPTTLTCAYCGGAFGSGDRYCAQCGAELFSCPGCGQSLLPSDPSCPECGTSATLRGSDDPRSFPPAESQSLWIDLVERLRRATLGEFEIGRELGRGGMAAVFLAHEVSLDRKVAIKVMSPGLLLDDGMIDRFRHEAITIAHLHHPNIVSVYSVRQAEGLHFFIMRYVQGRSLEQVIQQAGRLPLPMVRSILHQVGSALTYAHRSRVIHRDIKPANILIDGDGNAVVTDFGIAKAAETPTVTASGALVGTPAYMSPEQCSGVGVSVASDQYALGAVAYEMLTGVPPFSGSTLTVMQAHVERPPLPIREHRGDCPPELEAAILRMLAKEPEARFPRVADAMVALGAAPLAEDDPQRAELSQLAAAGAGPSLSGTPTPTSPVPRTLPSSPRGRTTGTALGGIIILPPPAGLEVGDSFVLVAMVRGQHGTRLPSNAVVWSCDPPGVLRFDSGGGVAVTVAPGSTLLAATCKGARALLRVEVVPPAPDEIEISPIDHAVGVGDEVRLEAIVRDKRGQPVDGPVTWQSADSSKASVTPDGNLMALAPGLTRITAASGSARASIVVPILPARVAAIHIADPPTTLAGGGTFVVSAKPVDRWGTPLPGRTVLWSSSDVRVAVVTAGGSVHALRAGSAVLTASCEGVSESIRVNVGEAPHAPDRAPDPRPGTHRKLRRRRRLGVPAVVLGALAVGGLFWLFGRSPARRAAAPDRPPSSVALAQPFTSEVPPVNVVITRRPGSALRPEGSTRLAAEVRDSAGRVIPGAAVVWTSSDSTVVRVDPSSGWLRAVRTGRAHVVAASGEGRDSAAIRVGTARRDQPVAASISIAPTKPLSVGDTLTLRAVVLDGKGDTLAGAAVAWHSSNLYVATINPRTGHIRAETPGTAVILAESGRESALAELSVHPPAEAEASGPDPGPPAGSDTLRAPAEPKEAGADPTRGSAEERQRIEARILAGVEECYAALRSKDVDRLAEMYHPVTELDEDNLKRLSRILRAEESAAAVDERVFGQRRIGGERAAMEFSFRLTWRDAFGGRHTSRPVFRAEFADSGEQWAMSSCRIIGSPNL